MEGPLLGLECDGSEAFHFRFRIVWVSYPTHTWVLSVGTWTAQTTAP